MREARWGSVKCGTAGVPSHTCAHQTAGNTDFSPQAFYLQCWDFSLGLKSLVVHLSGLVWLQFDSFL